jgi:hypothetical protein
MPSTRQRTRPFDNCRRKAPGTSHTCFGCGKGVVEEATMITVPGSDEVPISRGSMRGDYCDPDVDPTPNDSFLDCWQVACGPACARVAMWALVRIAEGAWRERRLAEGCREGVAICMSKDNDSGDYRSRLDKPYAFANAVEEDEELVKHMQEAGWEEFDVCSGECWMLWAGDASDDEDAGDDEDEENWW